MGHFLWQGDLQGEPDGKKKKPVPGVVEGGEAAWRIAFSLGRSS